MGATDPDDMSHEQVMHLFALEQSHQIFEKLVTCCYESILKPGDIAVDCGAHKGWHTLPMAKVVGSTGTIHAFEAIPSLAQEINDLIAAEHLPQVKVHNQAVSDAPGTASFYWIRNGEGVSGLRERDVTNLVPIPQTERIEVSVTTLDLLALESWRFCKLDVEGAELSALRGGRASLQRHHPVLVFENGRGDAGAVYGYTRDEYFAFFAGLGYAQYDLFGRPFGVEEWGAGYVPWNTIAVAAGSPDEDFVRQRYPELLRSVQAGCERSGT